ncbi:MAG: hypothetical protein J7K85_07615 [Anaerolineaceae bacterium]|nr:hypothetical protein [Anaerolineaceae bacterium]
MFDDIKRRFQDLPQKQMVTVGLILIIFLVLLNINSRLSMLFSKRQSVDTISTEVVALYATDVGLQTQIAAVEKDETVVNYGRENGFIQSGDIPVAIVGLEGKADFSVDEEIEETSPDQKLSNWELWWYLFFGR